MSSEPQAEALITTCELDTFPTCVLRSRNRARVYCQHNSRQSGQSINRRDSLLCQTTVCYDLKQRFLFCFLFETEFVVLFSALFFCLVHVFLNYGISYLVLLMVTLVVVLLFAAMGFASQMCEWALLMTSLGSRKYHTCH